MKITAFVIVGLIFVAQVPPVSAIKPKGKTWHKDLREYLVLMNLYKENLGVMDEVIIQNGKEIGLKVKIEYPINLKMGEEGRIRIKIFTQDYGYATDPDLRTISWDVQ